MKFEQKPVAEAGEDELRAYLVLRHGVEPSSLPKRGATTALRSALKKLEPDCEQILVIPVAATPAPAAVSVGEIPMGRRISRTDESGKTREYVRILVHTSDKPGGEEPVFVGVNGIGMYIPRGEEVEVPVEYAEGLDHARQLVYPQSDDPVGGLGEPREVHVYPFTFA